MSSVFPVEYRLPILADRFSTWPWNCTTHSTFLYPSAAARLPPVSPARDSSDPKYDSAPDSAYAPIPALNATTGMPASIAFFTAGAIAGGSGNVTARPSTFESIADWIRLAWLPDDG